MNKHAILPFATFALLGLSTLNYAAEQGPAKQESEKASANDVRQKVDDAAEAIKNYSIEKRDEAATKAKKALDALDSNINELEQQIDRDWDKMDKAARDQSRKTLKALREQRVKVAEWYGGLKNSSAAAWEEMKKGFSEAYKALQHSWQKAEHEYEKEERRSR